MAFVVIGIIGASLLWSRMSQTGGRSGTEAGTVLMRQAGVDLIGGFGAAGRVAAEIRRDYRSFQGRLEIFTMIRSRGAEQGNVVAIPEVEKSGAFEPGDDSALP